MSDVKVQEQKMHFAYYIIVGLQRKETYQEQYQNCSKKFNHHVHCECHLFLFENVLQLGDFQIF